MTTLNHDTLRARLNRLAGLLTRPPTDRTVSVVQQVAVLEAELGRLYDLREEVDAILALLEDHHD